MTNLVGYIAEVTEFESGWGTRPDGYILCLDKQKGIEFSEKDKGCVWCTDNSSDFGIASDFKLTLLTEFGYNKMLEKENNVIWICNGDLLDFIKD